MYISQIKINQFRLFEQFEVEMNPGLNVVVGENNSGKTALLDAIRLALETNSAEWSRVSDDDFHNNGDHFDIQIRFDGVSAQQAHVFVEHITHEKTGQGEKRRSVLYVNFTADRTDVIRRGARLIRTELRSGADGEGPIIEREIRDYLSATYLKPLRDAESELSAGRGSRLLQILSAANEFARSGSDFRDLLIALIEASQLARQNPGVIASRDKIGANFRQLTFADDQARFSLAIQMLGSKDFDKMSPTEREQAFRDILQRLSLTLDETKPLQGLGYNNVLFMATELILLEQEQDEFPLLLIEEPEAHLHPQLQMKFLKFVRDQFGRAGAANLQTIVTTHSPNLASKAPLDSLILMKGGKAYPMKAGATALATEDYIFLEKFLDVTKSNLFFAKGVIIVEGAGENILLPTFARLIGKPLEDFGVSIVNVGGTSDSRFARIFMRAGMDQEPQAWIPIRVACVRDIDLWPERADAAVAPDVGFKELKKRNRSYWLPREWNGERFGTADAVKRQRLESEGGQNVRVFVSEEWTFEYRLIRTVFSNAISRILNMVADEQPTSADPVDRAIQIYGQIDDQDAKTKVAYELAARLERFPATPRHEAWMRRRLPKYLVDAIDYVTGGVPNGEGEELALQDEAIR